MKNCVKCGNPLPTPSGRGRPRTRCETCAPSRVARRRAAIKTDMSGDGVLAATLAELGAADVIGSSAGQSALAIARRIEADTDSGASLAQLTRALRECMTAALGNEDVDADPIQALRDELAARREHRT